MQARDAVWPHQQWAEDCPAPRGVTNGGASSSNSVTAAIAAQDAALSAAGVPGITDANTGSGGVSGLSNDPCGDPVPWTGIQCANDRVTQL